jgi:hypothetical protein
VRRARLLARRVDALEAALRFVQRATLSVRRVLHVVKIAFQRRRLGKHRKKKKKKKKINFFFFSRRNANKKRPHLRNVVIALVMSLAFIRFVSRLHMRMRVRSRIQMQQLQKKKQNKTKKKKKKNVTDDVAKFK